MSVLQSKGSGLTLYAEVRLQSVRKQIFSQSSSTYTGLQNIISDKKSLYKC